MHYLVNHCLYQLVNGLLQEVMKELYTTHDQIPVIETLLDYQRIHGPHWYMQVYVQLCVYRGYMCVYLCICVYVCIYLGI